MLRLIKIHRKRLYLMYLFVGAFRVDISELATALEVFCVGPLGFQTLGYRSPRARSRLQAFGPALPLILGLTPPRIYAALVLGRDWLGNRRRKFW